MAKLGNIQKVKNHYIDRTTGKTVPKDEAETIIARQRAHGRMAGQRFIKGEQTIARRISDKDPSLSYSEAKQKAHERIKEWLEDKELYGDEEDYEEEELSP